MKSQKILPWLILGSIFFIIYAQTAPTITRTTDLAYDGVPNFFTLEVISHSDVAIIGDLYWVDVKITNNNETGGAYVTCGIRDTNESIWLAGNLPPRMSNLARSSIVILPPQDACQFPDKTQVVRVDLAVETSEVAQFIFRVPDRKNYSNAVYCEVIERCWATNASYYKSGSTAYWIDLVNQPNFSATTGNTSFRCKTDGDCNSIAYRYGGDMLCQQNYCIQKNNTNSSCVGSTCPPPSDTKGTESTFWQKANNFIADNELLIIGSALGLLVLGNVLWRKRR